MTHVIADGVEAVAAAEFAREAAPRDAEHILPRAGLDELSSCGLLGITCPAPTAARR
ncbi:hypothetical protein [Streptomyces griseoloalbus]|uniref:Uncharacterized protein n=1 Tax=Streptomyces griseoloalbus TaxID=67303 RepID=A0A7W8BN30_9ACTN|nr:hypothetical protein [Streptomyces albaduncus]GGW34928.1 hypothetical protein GCM10010340_10690 [Streptomyces albaduncus]